MSIRTIEAPGIELIERDNSNYNEKIDYSLPNSPIAFYCGFADRGENYDIQWINSYKTMIDTFGYPTNEIERYFHFGMAEMLNRGGSVIASKLPYFNASKDKFTYVDYFIDNNIIKLTDNIKKTDDEKLLKILNSIDSNIKSVLKINYKISDNYEISSGKISIEDFDKLKIDAALNQKNNSIKIVNLKGNKFNKVNFHCVSSFYDTSHKEDPVNTDEILGYVPVLVSPVQAMYYQEILNKNNLNIIENLDEFIKNKLNILKTFETVKSNNNIDKEKNIVFYNSDDIKIDLSELLNNVLYNFDSTDLNDYTFSKQISKIFPDINFIDENHFNSTYFKQIGVVVCKFFIDNDNNKKISMSIVESFIGSLDKNAKDPVTKSSIFLENIINLNSEYINIFININSKLLDNCDIIQIDEQIGTSLGFYNLDVVKNLDYDSSIINPLNMILDKINNPDSLLIDFIVDAGISNIAQFVWNYYEKTKSKNAFLQMGDSTLINEIKDLNNIDIPINDKESIKKWKYIVNKFDNFCKNIRKDCMFITDSPRGFCLDHNEKIVRPTNPKNTVKKDIISKLRFISDINSNFTAGYCNWFYTYNNIDNNFFWCPPSIKAAGIYCYIDSYFNTWDAPAGVNKGIVSKDVFDLAFNPATDEAGKIYNQCWNYALSYPTIGIVLAGQKTFQLNKTALDRINVRRLMLWLENNVKQVAKYFIYKQNTPYIRQLLIDTIEPILIYARDNAGISEYLIKCDEENNTSQTIENSEIHCQIAVRPIKTIEYIVLTFNIANQSMDLNETIIN